MTGEHGADPGRTRPEDRSADYPRAGAEAAEFWAARSRRVGWIHRPAAAGGPDPRTWFEGGTLNLCYNAVDRHVVRGHAEEVALVHASPLTGESTELGFAELLERVAELAGALRGIGAEGGTVALALPLLPELVVARLACVRIGAVPVVLPLPTDGDEPGTAQVWAGWLDALRPAVVLTASQGLVGEGPVALKRLVDRALETAAHRPAAVLVRQRRGLEPAALVEPRDLDWELAARLGRTAPAECVETGAADPATMLLPPHPVDGAAGGVRVRPGGGLAVALTWVAEHACGLGPGRRWRGAGDPATGRGQAEVLDLPLLAGAAAVLTEGRAPRDGVGPDRVPSAVGALVAGEDAAAPGACRPASGR